MNVNAIQESNCLKCKNTDCFIKQHCLSDEFEDFLARKHTFLCRKGQQFIIEGSMVPALFFVLNGKIKVSKTGYHGKEQIVRFATNGEIVGQRGFGICKVSPVSAEAIENTTLCSFTTEDIISMCHKIPSLAIELLLFYSEELTKSETKVKKFAQMTVREKVIDALLYFNRKFGMKDGMLDITLSRRDIANFAGTTEEQVIRTISSLKTENLLQAEGKKIGILNVDALKSEIADHNFFIAS